MSDKPETKSVINMVHRIQNRNPGYSDFASTQNNIQLNSIKSETIPNTSGANALKLDSDELKNTETEMFNSMVDENMAVNDMTRPETENKIDQNITLDEPAPLSLDETIDNNSEIKNGLENFDLIDETPQLFNSRNKVEEETIEPEVKSIKPKKRAVKNLSLIHI